MKSLLFLLALSLQDQGKPPERAAPYYPTPQIVVDRMLKLGELKKGEKVYDLGSGDGRIIVAAAQKFGATAVGIELDKALVAQSRQRLLSLNLGKLASVIEGDIFEQNYADANLITVYLLPITNIRLSPVLEKTIKKGVRIVCHDFEFTEWNPEKTEVMEDTEGRSHTLFFYRR